MNKKKNWISLFRHRQVVGCQRWCHQITVRGEPWSSSGTQVRSGLEPFRLRWSATVTLPLWFRRTILTMMRIVIDIPPKIMTVHFHGTISIPSAPSSAAILGFLPTTPRSHFTCSWFLSSLAWFPLSRSSTIGLVLSFHVISDCVHFRGFVLCFCDFFFFFFPPFTCACVWLLRKCGKEMRIWVSVGVWKNH